MRKIALMLAGAAIFGGSFVATTTDASAHRYHGWKHRHHNVCRTIIRKKVVYRHGHRVVIRDRIRRCF